MVYGSRCSEGHEGVLIGCRWRLLRPSVCVRTLTLWRRGRRSVRTRRLQLMSLYRVLCMRLMYTFRSSHRGASRHRRDHTLSYNALRTDLSHWHSALRRQQELRKWEVCGINLPPSPIVRYQPEEAPIQNNHSKNTCPRVSLSLSSAPRWNRVLLTDISSQGASHP